MISTRHIRHDWNTWVNWEQNSVKTMCGAKSRPGLCGIPGVTEQPQVVDKNGKKVWGWCSRCVKTTWYYLLPPGVTKDSAPPEIFVLHERARAELAAQFHSILLSQFKSAVQSNRTNSAQYIERELKVMESDYPSLKR